MSVVIGTLLTVLMLMAVLLTPILAVISIKNHALPFLRNTYIFWAIVSLYNWSLLGGLSIPPLLIFHLTVSNYYTKFLPFLRQPLWDGFLLSTIVTIVIMFAFKWFRQSPTGRELLPLLFNLLFFAAFLRSAEHHKNEVIAQQLSAHSPDCVQISSFLDSLAYGGASHSGGVHALFTEGGKIYFWSYAKQDWFEMSEGLARNYHCTATNDYRNNVL